MIRNEGPAEETHDEELPFALPDPVPTTPSSPCVDESSRVSLKRHESLGQAGSTTIRQGGSEHHSSSVAESTLLHNNSQFLDTAASLLNEKSVLAESSLTTVRSQDQGPSQAVAWQTDAKSLAPRPEASVRFSQLLRQASDSYYDDTQRRQLTGIHEEQSWASYSDAAIGRLKQQPSDDLPFQSPPRSSRFGPQQQTDHRVGGNSSSSILFHQRNGLAETIIPAGPESSLYRSEDRRIANLAGATGTRTGDHSFAVSVELAPSTCSVQDIMDILGNPEMLPLWCDAVTDLVITRSSEGAARTSDDNSNDRLRPADREYEGQWIEATCSPLALPKRTSIFYRSGRCLSSVLGFPNYGRIHMFVERQLCQIGITMAPFPGTIEVSHKFEVGINPRNDKVRIVDSVVLQSDESQVRSLCGILDALGACLLPSIDDYMDQCLSSMARLRFLAENGDRASGYEGDHAALEVDWQAASPLLARG